MAAIKFPNENKMEELAALVEGREPQVTNVIGFVDGVSFPTQCSSDVTCQYEYYNGYTHETQINNVFAFSSEGKIIYACLNYPGSWHDAQVAQHLMDEVCRSIGRYALCVDQGFPRSKDMRNKFVGPLSAKARTRIDNSPLPLDPAEREEALLRRARLVAVHELYVSLRQAAEWGMRALQGTFSRLKTKLTSDKRTRRDILLAIVLLHNFRTECVGLNQIATVFNREYEQYINIEGYDRIARYFHF